MKKFHKEESPETLKDSSFWEDKLTPDEYEVTRNKGTEPPFSGKFNLTEENGEYFCKCCGALLFKSKQKFISNCGWPSFDDGIKENLKFLEDLSHGMQRTEVQCAVCDSHLGHIFNDGPTETGMRYCINSLSIDFEKK